jgi:hypothetical protein
LARPCRNLGEAKQKQLGRAAADAGNADGGKAYPGRDGEVKKIRK